MKRPILLAAIAALGLAAALGITAKTAAAYDIGALPAPYTVDAQYDASNGDCPNFYVVHWYDQQVRLNYGVNSHGSDCNSQFQHDLDAFVDATINQPPPVTTTAPVTTAVTTTDATTPAVTTTAPPTTTDAQPAPAQTVTVTTTIVDPTIDARIAALEKQYAALAARVDAIATANTASWTAFIDATNAGASAADAAIAARSAGLNAIYQLG